MASTAIAVVGGLPVGAAGQDPSAAPGVVKSQKKLSLTLYGQVTRQFGFVGDGESVTFKQGPNANTATRMGIDGRGRVTKDVSLRTRLEFEIRGGSDGGGSQFVNQGGSNSFVVRHLDVILSHKRLGDVWIGRGDSATNGTSEVNLAPGMESGRLGGSVHHIIGRYVLLDENEALAVRAVGTVDRFFGNFDGAGRQNRIRYDSPTMFGSKLSVGMIDKHNIDAALHVGARILGTEIRGAVGWCHTKGSRGAGDGACWGNGTTVEGVDQIGGSVSIRTPIGLGVTVVGAKQWLNRAGVGHSSRGDPSNIQPSIWYAAKLNDLGTTTIEYAFQYTRDGGGGAAGFKDDKGTGHAVTLLQQIDSVGGDYWLGFRYVDVETATNNNIEPLWFVGAGFRQRF